MWSPESSSRSKQQARLRHLQYDDERDVYVDPYVITQAARERVAARAKKDKELRREAAKRLEFSQIDTLKGLTTLGKFPSEIYG